MDRRSVLQAISTGLAVGIAGCLEHLSTNKDEPRIEPPENGPDGAWPTEHHDAKNTRHVEVTGPRSDIEVAWERETERDQTDPIVVSGMLFDQEHSGSRDDSRIVTRSTISGERTSIALDGMRGYLGGIADSVGYITAPESETATITAHSVESDTRYWTREDAGLWIRSIAHDDETIFVQTEFDYPLYAFDTHGVEQWRFDPPSPSSGFAVSGDVVTVVVGDRLIGLNRATGVRQWIQQVGGTISTQPLVNKRTVVVGDRSDTVTAFSINGDRLWQTELGETPESFASETDSVWVGSAPVTQLDIETGKQLRRLPDVDADIITGTDNAVYAARGGHLEAIDTETNESLWSHSLGRNTCQGMAIVDGMLFLSTCPFSTDTAESTLYAFRES